MKPILCHWFWLNHMDESRINKKIFLQSHRTRQKNKHWCLRVDKILQKPEISLNTGTFYNKTQRQFVIESLQDILFTEYKADWKIRL